MALWGLVLGSLTLHLKGMRIVMFQLSGFYYNTLHISNPGSELACQNDNAGGAVTDLVVLGLSNTNFRI